MIKKIITLSLLLTTITFTSCKKNESNVLLIGEYGSLTGGTATFGQSVHKGVKMATAEINQQGGLLGKQIKVITEDDQSKPEEAKNAILKLIKQNQVKAVIGEVASSRSLAAAPEAQKAKIPMISPASTNPKVTEVGDYIFRACFIDTFQGEAMAKFAFEKLGLKKVSILKDIKNDYSVGLADFFEKTFKKIGGEIVEVQSYSEGDSDFRAQLTSIKSKNPEGLYIPGYYTEVGLIARQAKELGVSIPLMGGDGWDSSKTLEIGGTAVNGAYFSNHYAVDDPSPVVQQFIQKFKKEFNEVPDAMAVLGYDSAHLLYDAIKRANSDEPSKIRDALASTQVFAGVSGQIKMDENRNAQKRLVILKIDEGKIKFADAVNP